MLALKKLKKHTVLNAAELHARVKVRITETVDDEDGNRTTETKLVDTTIGRAMLMANCTSRSCRLALVNQKLG